MKLLDLFSTGTAGTTGTSLQGQGNSPSRFGPGKTGQRDENTGTEGVVSLSRPARPGPDYATGTEEIVDTVGPSRPSRSSRSENDTEKVSDPTPEQLAHMQRLLVDCPDTPGTKWHCWYCSRCPKAAACFAWRHLAVEVKLFRLSEPPYSLYLAERKKAVVQ